MIYLRIIFMALCACVCCMRASLLYKMCNFSASDLMFRFAAYARVKMIRQITQKDEKP